MAARIKYPSKNDSGQRQMMHDSVSMDRKVRRQAVEMMNHPDHPLTRAEISELVKKRPNLYNALRPLTEDTE